jgi:[CysO sulfur-carrier protein]-S-L-cysteine hydrolase
MRPQTSLRTVRISRAHWDRLVAHAREEVPNECCGYLRARDGVVDEVYRAENQERSPYGFSFGFEALRAANELDDEGWEVATYHSHPKSPAEPSQQDINVVQYENWRHLIVSLAGEPEVRVWWIRDGNVEEEELDVVDG